VGRKQYAHLKLTCHRGINQQRGLATLEECAEASNVWAPDGVIEQRPGYVGLVSFPFVDWADNTTSGCVQTFITETTGGSFATTTEGNNMTLNSWATNAFWYIGFNKVSGAYTGVTDDRFLLAYDTGAIPAVNTNQMGYDASYYNGTEFVALRVIERKGNPNTTESSSVVSPHLSDARGSMFCFCPPGDWASTTINSVAAFFLRFKIKPRNTSGSDSTLASGVLVGNATAGVHHISSRLSETRGLFVGQFPSTKRYISVNRHDAGTSVPKVRWLLASDHEFSDVTEPDFEQLGRYEDASLATHAVVPQFGEGFVAYGGIVKRYSLKQPWPHATDGTDFFATRAAKEVKDFAVGPEAPFDPDYVRQLGSFPTGDIIVYFKNRLWVSGSSEEPYAVKWGAATPYHKVFPNTANDLLMEDDNSPITGMAPLGEHLAVFKRDSIWLMVAVGENSITGVTDFRGRKIVDGVGCVSNASIQQIMGRLVFLAEDGIYSFDGTPTVQKLSDRVSTTVASINKHKTAFTVSAHWKTKNCYLLSVPTRGANDNNKTLVYDYKNDTWWIWDIPVALWLNDEGEADEETLYFLDNKQCMNLLGFGNTDHGQAITSTVLTQRIGETDNIRRTVRQVEVTSDNRATSLTVAVRANDDSNGDDSGTLSLTDDSEAEYASSLLFTAGTKYVLDRNRARRLSFRKQGDWLQVLVTHDTHNTPMSIRAIDVGVIDGTRR
tara:strand:- start:186 stop:2348 length:2163 start_codon:yes stop_codon:yes gene_type:complete